MHLLKIEKKQTLIKLPLTLKKKKKTRQLQANEVSKLTAINDSAPHLHVKEVT
jgi:hypothetical protein